MKTRRMVQALYDLLGCDYEERYDAAGYGSGYGLQGGAIIRERYKPGLLEANTREHVTTAKHLAALLAHLGLRVQEYPGGVRIVTVYEVPASVGIVKTKKAKGTKRA